jgi:hypothetical protein
MKRQRASGVLIDQVKNGRSRKRTAESDYGSVEPITNVSGRDVKSL